MEYDVIVLGSFVMAITVRVPRMPYAGETLVGDMFDLGPGGKGTNQAVAAARQEARVAIVAKVGRDEFAERARRLYRDESIDDRHVSVSSDEPTAAGLVYLQPDGENRIALYRGANWHLSAGEVEAALAALGTSNVFATQLEVPDEAVAAGVHEAKRSGMTVLLNPAPARKLPEGIAGEVDILTPNEGEARVLAGFDPRDDTVGPEVTGARLNDLGFETVVITMGTEGSALFKAGKPAVRISAFAVETVDTVGAGDAFNGGLAAALARGLSLEEALRWANATAALSTRGLGSIRSLPREAEVRSLFG